MRNLLALIGLAVIVVGGAGWYLGWYKLSVSRTPEGNLQIQTDVDTQKVGTDSTEALKNVGAVIGTQASKALQDAKKSQPVGTPGTTPGPISPSNNPDNPKNSTLPPIPSVPDAPVPPPAPTPAPGPIPLIAPKPN